MGLSTYVVIVTYNGASWIRTCLDSVRQQTGDIHVVLVDNASTDGTVTIVREHYPEVRLIETGRNLGFGVGNNLGIASALGDGARYVLLLNQDAYLPADALARLLVFMEHHPEIDVCSPLHCSPDVDHLDNKTFNNYLKAPRLDFLQDAVLGRVSEHYLCHGVNAAIWLSKANTFQRVGGFDPIFFMYGEDDDLLNRLAYHKLSFALVPGVRGVHLRQSPPVPDAGRLIKFQRKSRRRRAELMLFVKQPGNSNLHSLAVLLSNGLLRPLSSFVMDRDLEALLVSTAASFRTLMSWRSLMAHKRLCRSLGPHFLAAEHAK